MSAAPTIRAAPSPSRRPKGSPAQIAADTTPTATSPMSRMPTRPGVRCADPHSVRYTGGRPNTTISSASQSHASATTVQPGTTSLPVIGSVTTSAVTTVPPAKKANVVSCASISGSL